MTRRWFALGAVGVTALVVVTLAVWLLGDNAGKDPDLAIVAENGDVILVRDGAVVLTLEPPAPVRVVGSAGFDDRLFLLSDSGVVHQFDLAAGAHSVWWEPAIDDNRARRAIAIGETFGMRTELGGLVVEDRQGNPERVSFFDQPDAAGLAVGGSRNVVAVGRWQVELINFAEPTLTRPLDVGDEAEIVRHISNAGDGRIIVQRGDNQITYFDLRSGLASNLWLGGIDGEPTIPHGGDGWIAFKLFGTDTVFASNGIDRIAFDESATPAMAHGVNGTVAVTSTTGAVHVGSLQGAQPKLVWQRSDLRAVSAYVLDTDR